MKVKTPTKVAFAFYAIATLAACSDQGTPSNIPSLVVTPPESASEQVKQIVIAAWPKVFAACPGFAKYASDLTYIGIDENLNYAPENAKRVNIKFKVADRPTLIPAEFRSFGHICYYSISPDGKKLSISKRGCASTCMGTEVPDAEPNSQFEKSLE